MKKRWYSITEHVDIETGELLTTSQLKREYWDKVGKEEKIDYSHRDYNLKKIIYHYEKSKQQRLWD